MAKKKSKKKGLELKKLFELNTPHVSGGLLLCSSFIILLSLVSFAAGNDATHALGHFGYMIGWAFTGVFGLTGYIFSLYLGWIGWRLFFNKPINHPRMKHFFMTILLLSVGMLLTLIEVQAPTLRQMIGHIFYKGLWDHKLYFHFGGTPMYYIYKDLPGFNLHQSFNTIGVGIIASFTLLASLIFFTKTSPKRLLELFASIFEKEKLALATGDDQRFVKLRTPSQELQGQEMMEINPDRNLLVRPSISRKEKEEENISKPFEGVRGSQRKVEVPVPAPAAAPDAKQKRETAIVAQRVFNGDYTKYKLPPMTLLTDPVKVDQSSLKKDLKRQAEVLEETLA